METDTLHTLVSSAIWRAEQLEAQVPGSAPRAWEEVASLEEALAISISPLEPEGRIARRGAVRAALKAGSFARAQALVERFLSESDISDQLREALREMLEEDARTLARRFPHAAKQYPVGEARNAARRLRLAGPFSLAA